MSYDRVARATPATQGGAPVALCIDERDGIPTLTLDRPEARNALDSATLVELANAWVRFEREDGLPVRATGNAREGPRAF